MNSTVVLVSVAESSQVAILKESYGSRSCQSASYHRYFSDSCRDKFSSQMSFLEVLHSSTHTPFVRVNPVVTLTSRESETYSLFGWASLDEVNILLLIEWL